MSSTNKTANLKLNQWVLTDPFLMEDMNADNQKIDAAVNANPYVKLMDITTASSAQQVDLNVSGIDLSKYGMLQLFAAFAVTPMGTANAVHARINNTGGYQFDTMYNASNYFRDYIAYYGAPTNDLGVARMEISDYTPSQIRPAADTIFRSRLCQRQLCPRRLCV